MNRLPPLAVFQLSHREVEIPLERMESGRGWSGHAIVDGANLSFCQMDALSSPVWGASLMDSDEPLSIPSPRMRWP